MDTYLSLRLLSNPDYANQILEKLLSDFREATRQTHFILPIMTALKRAINLVLSSKLSKFPGRQSDKKEPESLSGSGQAMLPLPCALFAVCA